MATYIILSRISPEAFSDPFEAYGHSTTETLAGIPWDDFLEMI